ncbi:F-box protein [Senna tora]|uniref:F-box protein n=1 Tax=Senna tora TaxID=362788 RepID=A0A834X417_9FABA|nr:F-box protein [Senna tora]
MNRNKKRAGSDVSESSCKIQVLPPNIIIDILSRLPIRTILSCKRVCKGWLRLISHPRFLNLQLSRSSTAVLVKTVPSVHHSRKITLTQVDQRVSTPFRFHKLVFTPKNNLPSSSKFGLVNSCNGFLCLAGVEKDDPIWVCNPILGEYVTIPPPVEGRNRGSFGGLGFCTVTNRYKVLQTFYPNVELSGKRYLNAAIYCLYTATWRSIGYAPGVPVALPFNSLLHGSLHWVPNVGKSAEYIYSFNFETEEFGSVPPPPGLDETHKGFSDYLRLGVLEGCLFLCVFGDDTTKFDIWVMKDYGVKESWTKQLVIENLYPRDLSPDYYEPIQFFNNGDILMLYNYCEVVCYNTETKTFRCTNLTRTRNLFDSIAHIPSLFSLYHVTRRDQVQRVKGRKECANLCVQGTVDCPGLETSHNEPARFDSTLYQGHPGQNADHRTEFMSTANAAANFDHNIAQGIPTPHINDDFGNLASIDSYPFLWHL